ncbi:MULTISPECIES: PucR family transcriptional regulator [unclassified Nocardioides]|uniref:PucR family transcriptional regulator n=1 Tax=unclassified Nocardioides TaxID=2615069 RepID=UPI000702DB3A|nr:MULTISPECIES: helix-turn-helix domain-containing protein [unclassified Nocardioides]KRC48902.1 hypothetical protein ASE19_18495 [Nocardioides sp. Root79]KRC75301.1 hypothetical protein ASE20_20395 [Nocardioides sp. Root240]
MEYLDLSPDERAALAGAGRALLKRKSDMLEGLHSALERAVPGYLLVPERAEMESMEANLALLFTMLEHGAWKAGTPADALEAARLAARLGLTQVDLARIYHYGQDVLWNDFLAPALAVECSDADMLSRSSRVAFRVLSEFLTRVERDVSEQMRRELVTVGSPAERIDAVKSVLTGSDPGADLLGYPLLGRHLAFICWATPGDGADHATVLDAATAVARVLPARARLVVQASARTAYGWANVRPSEKVNTAHVESLLRERAMGVHVAIGTGTTGVNGFRAGHEEARIVFEHVSRGLRPAPSVTDYDRIALLSLLLADRDQAVTFARRQLGDLAGEGIELRQLRDTVRIYLGAHLSPLRTAQALHLHRNTVNNRIKRAEAMLGYPLADSRFELQAALTVLHSLEKV